MADSSLEALVGELERLSPMPDDTGLEADQVDRYDDLVTAISHALGDRFDERAVRALVYSFGIGDGFEMYWSTLHAIERFHETEETYQIVREAVGSGAPGARKWCCFLLGRRRHLDDLPLLIARLQDAEERVIQEALRGIAMIAQVHRAAAAIGPVSGLLSDPRPVVARRAHEVLQALESREGPDRSA